MMTAALTSNPEMIPTWFVVIFTAIFWPSYLYTAWIARKNREDHYEEQDDN